MWSRREFVAAGGAGAFTALPAAKPALLGGTPAHPGEFPAWPVFDAREERALLATLRSRKWLRVAGDNVNRFERDFAAAMGSPGCVATSSGTAALILSLKALGVGPGDEVLVPPYTFIATINAVLMVYALPVFVDTDIETAQIDARKIEPLITGRTRAIMPVHLGGSAADLDTILEVARRHRLPVIEDACQAHLGEWRNRKLGTFGDTGCFSFQATKNMCSGEGGALLSGDAALLEKCFAIHNHGRTRAASGYNFTYRCAGANLRMDEFHAAMAAAQLTRLEQFARKREENARYLTGMLRQIPGIVPAAVYPGCTRHAWHLYLFRYRAEEFAGISKRGLLRALAAEGIPASSGYSPLNREPFLEETLATREFRAVCSREQLARWKERNHCPRNDRLCAESVWLSQNMLLGTRADMEQIAEAVRKIQVHAAELVKRLKL